ncbi:MAG: helix-turn-helix transcriptional regulator [Ruminococcaceae bacterium]|nr:helix-turn-helix transcriptional regulator [Oscillospiraceae bacterium]
MNRIRDLREDMDLRQIDVANSTGIDQKTLSNYETGKTNPDSEAIVKLADFFGVSTDYLLCRTAKNKPSAEALSKKISRIQTELTKIMKDIEKYY